MLCNLGLASRRHLSTLLSKKIHGLIIAFGGTKKSFLHSRSYNRLLAEVLSKLLRLRSGVPSGLASRRHLSTLLSKKIHGLIPLPLVLLAEL